MTIEQKLDLRQRAYMLAQSVLADAEWAEGAYKFLARAFEEKTQCGASPPSETKEIDWSRPQLVRGIGGHYGQILMTNGVHGDWNFTGKFYLGGNNDGQANSNVWPKNSFVYHGEIPTEKATGLNFLEAVKLAWNEIGAMMTRPENPIYYFDEGGNFRMGYDSSLPVLNNSDFSATDWQIVKS